MVNHHELVIKHIGDRNGYRIVTGKNSTQFMPNPKVLPGETVTWLSPHKDACIAFLKDSPFTRAGKPVRMEVIELKAGKPSPAFKVAKNLKQGDVYEYAVLIQEAPRDYTYVRGAASPPGVAVGP
jgi:hypothetical protein